MTMGRILLAEDVGLAEPLGVAMSRQSAPPELVAFKDGALVVAAFVRFLKAQQLPQLIVLDGALNKITGKGVALAVRSIERGLGATPTAILLYTPEVADNALKELLGSLGRAVHLQRPSELPVKEQGKRLAVAIERLVAQLRGQ